MYKIINLNKFQKMKNPETGSQMYRHFPGNGSFEDFTLDRVQQKLKEILDPKNKYEWVIPESTVDELLNIIS